MTRLLEEVADQRHHGREEVEVLAVKTVDLRYVHLVDVLVENADEKDDEKTPDGPGVGLRALGEEGVVRGRRVDAEQTVGEGGVLWGEASEPEQLERARAVRSRGDRVARQPATRGCTGALWVRGEWEWDSGTRGETRTLTWRRCTRGRREACARGST